jgi:hypothetical protein
MELEGLKPYEKVLRYAYHAPEYLVDAAARFERPLEVVNENSTISQR